MNIKTLTVKILLIAVLGTMLVMPATAATATRTLPGDCVEPGSEFTVTITAEDYGLSGAVTETLCSDWDYVSVTDVGDVRIEGNNIKFLLMGSGPITFTYTVLAPDEVGACCQISGTLRDADTQDHTVTGATEVRVCGDPLYPVSAIRDISKQTVKPGSTFGVTLTLTANEDIQSPALKENLPAGWAVTEVLNGDAAYKASTTEWIWTTAMSGGDTKTVIYDVAVPADATPQDYDITGQVSAYDVSPVAIDGESTVTVEPENIVCPISAIRDISDQTVNSGSTFTVTLTLTAKDVIQAPALKETLPAGWTVTEVDNGGATYKPATTEWVWSAAMSSGDANTVTYKVTVPAGATSKDYHITGQASAHDISPVAIDGESIVTVEPENIVDPISAIRDISDQTVNSGSTFTVTLTLTAKDVIQAPALKETLPAGWTVTEVDNGGATYKPATTEWVWSAAMSSGDAKTVTYKVTVPAGAASQDYQITGQASAHDVSPVAIGGESKVTVGIPTQPTPPPTPPPAEVPILTSSGICALIAMLCIAGAGVIVNRGRKR